MKKLNLLSALIIGCVVSTPAMAGKTATVNTVKILQMINTSGDDFGGCMIKLDKSPKDSLSICKNDWLTLSCNGALGNSKAQAAAMWNSAQMAFVLDRPIRVKFSDDRKNGFCSLTYIRVEKNK